ncbi:MAG: hypothetical protein HKN23_13335 [Verrucomicrobiales bacterium]|nr:hypothetical protein [Verrucomicrobiales bacterium]
MKKIRTVFTIFFGMLTAGLVLSSCDSNSSSENSGSKTGGTFLATDYEPLDNWLEERFEVKYKNMTPQLIFNQVPINDIHYDTSDLPEGAPTFNFESDNISRREVLQKISDFWGLRMSIQNGPDGNPSSVVVKG